MIRFVRPAQPTFALTEIYGLIGVLLLFTARFIPLARYWPYWGCPMRRQLGIPCLSCGMTRSFDWFMHGRFGDSLAINPLGFALAVASTIGGIYFALFLLRQRPPRLEIHLPDSAQLWARGAVIVALLANWGWVLARSFGRA